jgi:pyridinium-3,5-biscarboxylic acid mononucleotide sulfurtransferase
VSGSPEFGAKRAALLADLASRESIAIAFSGGVDSSVLLHAAHLVLGERAIGVVADSASLPRRELADARQIAADMGANLVELLTTEQDDDDYRANRGDRCYFCKAALFDALQAYCGAQQIPWMAFGEITDDAMDDRPGALAAREAGVLAPLSAAGFGKDDVRRYARDVGMDVADKPASACLASRIPVGTRVSRERLAQVESAENALHDLGLRQVRVRHLGTRARVEVGADEVARADDLRVDLTAALAACGYTEFEVATYRSPVETAST